MSLFVSVSVFMFAFVSVTVTVSVDPCDMMNNFCFHYFMSMLKSGIFEISSVNKHKSQGNICLMVPVT